MPLQEILQLMVVELVERNKILQRELDYHKSLLKKVEEDAESDKKNLEKQIIKLHQQNYALEDEVKRLTETSRKKSKK